MDVSFVDSSRSVSSWILSTLLNRLPMKFEELVERTKKFAEEEYH